MSEVKLGNVNDRKLDETLRQRFYGCCVHSKPECSECWEKYYCSGGCMANSYNYCGGDLNKPYKPACELMKKRVECALAVRAIEEGDA